MNAETPNANQNPVQDYAKNPEPTLLAGSAGSDAGAAARYERGEIDVFTLVTALPETAVPPSLHAAYQTAKQVMDAPHFRAIADDRKRDQQTREFLNQLALWRLQRGTGYVAAYEQFERTGKAVDAGKRVFESDWFRQLQEQREREIAALEQKQQTGNFNQDDRDRRDRLLQAKEGDDQIKQGWASLADDYQKIKARENTGAMTEDELREKEAQLKQRLFDQLDKASPELRARLLGAIAAADPSLRSEYEDRLQARGAAPLPVTPALEETIAEVRALPESVDFLIEDVVVSDRPASAAKTQGIDGIKTGVNVNGAFAVAVAEHGPAPDVSDSGLNLTRTGKHLTSDLA